MSGSTSRVARRLLSPATMRGQLLRFVVVGGVNTTCTTVAFYLLATVLPAEIAFTIVYLAGIVFVVVVTPRYVFASSSSPKRRLLLALWYLATYGVGVGLISLLTTQLSASRLVVVLGTVLVTAPLGFVGARLLVGRRR